MYDLAYLYKPLLAIYQAPLCEAIRKARIQGWMKAFRTYGKRLDQMVRAF